MIVEFRLLIICPLLLFGFGINAQEYNMLPENIYTDTLYAPFYHGVASGDPLPDKVIIWTRISTDITIGTLEVEWQVFDDPSLNNIVVSGVAITSALRDWTVKVDVDGLEPDSYYYYRFKSTEGEYSAIGRTKTAPQGNVENVKLAVASCSSIYSGFFNAYARIGERNDLDAVIHLGDYVYNKMDQDEPIRVPDPEPQSPQGLEEWRARHLYYCLDADLRLARQQHPFIVIWDNHDLEADTVSGYTDAAQAFVEWSPIRENITDSQIIYRSFTMGDLVDIVMMDTYLRRNIDEVVAGEYSILGNEQFDWMQNTLLNSNSKWKVLGGQKMFSNWSSEGIPDEIAGIEIPNDGDVFDNKSWDGYQMDRHRVLDIIEDSSLDNFVFLSGDAHVSVANDVTRAPAANDYDPDTGEGALAVEFLPTSISRGNFDESGVPANLIPLAETISSNLNPHQFYVEFSQHGYGVLDIKADSIIAQYWYSEILESTDMEVLGKELVVKDGVNHWQREATVGIRNITKPNFQLSPNPVQSDLEIKFDASIMGDEYHIELLNAKGESMFRQFVTNVANESINIPMSSLASGLYIVKVSTNNTIQTRKVVKF